MLSAIAMILAGFVVIGLIIVANAYFVAQEFSFMSVDRTQLRSMAAEGDKSAQRALDITCLLYTSPSPRDRTRSRMPSSA